jgi:Uma2 family endonuclease
MPTISPTRPFEPGTPGWTVDDLEDPAIERLWFQGTYEIVDGVLTKMPAAYFPSGMSLFRLMQLIDDCVKRDGPAGDFSMEVDLVLRPNRVARADAVFLTNADKRAQRLAARRAGKIDPDRTRILVPPTLVIESISPDHESHDQSTKRRWYAEAGIPNYWIVDAYARTLDCLVLDGPAYRPDVSGRSRAKLRPSAFPGLILNLGELWK